MLTRISSFNFVVSLAITRKAFDFTHSVTALPQVKSNDVIHGFELIGSLIDLMSNIWVNLDKYHDFYIISCIMVASIKTIILTHEIFFEML